MDVLRGKETGNSVIVVGGGMIGSDVALFLAEQGKKVTVTTRGDSIIRDMDPISCLGFLERMSGCELEILTGLYLVEITDEGVAMLDKRGEKTEMKADTVVLAGGLSPDRRLFDELCHQQPGLEVYGIGDCVEPRKIFDAVHEGYEVALKI